MIAHVELAEDSCVDLFEWQCCGSRHPLRITLQGINSRQFNSNYDHEYDDYYYVYTESTSKADRLGKGCGHKPTVLVRQEVNKTNPPTFVEGVRQTRLGMPLDQS